jgi:hypothetical protein
LDLKPLKALQGELPETLIARMRLAWPEIKIALSQGHSLKAVHERLTYAGVPISYRRLSDYVVRLRREEKRFGAPRANAEKRPLDHNSVVQSDSSGDGTPERHNPRKSHPLSDFRERAAKAKSFEFEPGPPDETKLI